MLVITRRIRESVIITGPDGTETILHILGIAGNQVRLGFDAPRSVRILRDDIVSAVPREVRDGNTTPRRRNHEDS